MWQNLLQDNWGLDISIEVNNYEDMFNNRTIPGAHNQELIMVFEVPFSKVIIWNPIICHFEFTLSK